MWCKKFLFLFIPIFILFPLYVYSQNLALTATARSSGGSTLVLGPENVNDGMREGAGNPHWINPAAGNWIELVWPTPQRVGCMWVDTSSMTGRILNEIEIQIWDGSSYVTVGLSSGIIDDWFFEFGSVDTANIRLLSIGMSGKPVVYEIEVYGPGLDCSAFNTATPTPSPTGSWYSPTPTPTSACDLYASLYEHWSMCEMLQDSPPVTPRTRSRQWDFNDCWYCRNISNPCFQEPCTFALYVAVECGNRLSIPLFDVESAGITVMDCEKGRYENLTAASTGGWFASGTLIQWKDCVGIDPRWNNQTTDIYLEDPYPLCGVYRLELINWASNIWELYANCGGGPTPGFWVYDSLEEARASFIGMPELSISNLRVSGICPDYNVTADVHNWGCSTTDVTVCLETSLGGSWEFIVPMVGPGATETGSGTIVAPTCADPFVLTATVDCHDDVAECSEAGGSAIPCIKPGTYDPSVSIDVLPPVPLRTGIITYVLLIGLCAALCVVLYVTKN